MGKGERQPNLVRIAQDFHQRGWMSDSAGNLSARSTDHPSSFWVTASGLTKSELEASDSLRIDINSGEIKQQPQDSTKPFSGDLLHQTIYLCPSLLSRP